MNIHSRYHDEIRCIDIGKPKTVWKLDRWKTSFPGTTAIGKRLNQIHAEIGIEFGRDDVVRFYRKTSIGIETKFLSAMVWGHEASAGERPDSRGPWKVKEMFKDLSSTTRLLERVSIADEASLHAAYGVSDEIPWCGQSFYTKHLYFLGKARAVKHGPLIFDNRVASGIAKLLIKNDDGFRVISIAASRNWSAYAAYLRFAHEQAERIQCQPDQIEYFLFKLGGESQG